MTKLTTATYVKIVLVVLLCLVLCGGIFSCSVGCSTAARHAGQHFQNMYEDYELTEVGDAAVDAASVRNISVEWPAGQVVFQTSPDGSQSESERTGRSSASAHNTDTDHDDADHSSQDHATLGAASDAASDAAASSGQITLVETATNNLPDELRMHWELSGDTLKINYGRSSWGMMGCSTMHKNLVITIPESTAHRLGAIYLSAASGSYELNGIGCELLEVNLASGQVNGQALSADYLSLDVASGTVSLEGTFPGRMGLSLASGGIDIQSATCPDSADISVASGTVTVGMPEQSSASVAVNKLSGSFNCNFPDSVMAKKADGWYVIGDGTASFNVDIMSGQVNLRSL